MGFFGFDIQSFKYGSPEHVVVRSELHQLLTRVAGNGDLDHISFKDTKRISCELMKEKLRFIRLIVVVFKKGISVKYSDCGFIVFVIRHAKHMSCIVLSPFGLSPLPYLSHYFKYGCVFGINKQRLCFVSFCKIYLKHF
jgi:hypothetical protein